MPSQTTAPDGLLEALPDALLGVDQSGLIRFVNHQSESLFGYAPGELVGMPVETLVPQSHRQAHEAHRESYNAAPRTRPMGTDLFLIGLRRDGTEFPVDISLGHLDTEDGLLVVASVRDNTDRRKTEAESRQLARLAAMIEFGAPANVLDEESLMKAGIVTQFGKPPQRIDLLNEIDGVTFSEVWKGAMTVRIDGQRINVIGLKELRANKGATGRKKDEEDLRHLKARAARKTPKAR